MLYAMPERVLIIGLMFVKVKRGSGLRKPDIFRIFRSPAAARSSAGMFKKALIFLRFFTAVFWCGHFVSASSFKNFSGGGTEKCSVKLAAGVIQR
ncbi:MAG: hypothetical protein PUI99_05755 [Clostridiales bacterium]|nr:hypothetical protein [Clostridiales bacterium]